MQAERDQVAGAVAAIGGAGGKRDNGRGRSIEKEEAVALIIANKEIYITIAIGICQFWAGVAIRTKRDVAKGVGCGSGVGGSRGP